MLALFKNRHVLSLTGNGVMAVFSILTYSILYRFLPETDMGNWVFFQFAFLLLDTFRTGLLQTPLIKFYAGADAARQTTVAGSSWFIGLLVTGFFVVLNLATLPLAPYTNDTGVLLLLAYFGISLVVTLPFNVAVWLLQAEQRFDAILAIRLLNQGSFILLTVLLYLLGKISLQGIVYSFLASSLLTSVVALVMGWARLGALRHKTSECVAEVFHFGKYSFGTFLCATLLRSSDTFIIKFMLGPAALAVYNLPQRLLEIIEIPLRSGLATAMPDMSAAMNRKRHDEVAYTLKKYAGSLTLLFIPITIGVLIFADVIVYIIGGQKYVHTEAANIYRIMIVCALLFPIERFLGVTLDIINKPQLNLIKVLIALAINTTADIVCIKFSGSIYGAAVASAFTLVASLGYGYWILNKYLPLDYQDIFPLAVAEFKSRLDVLFRKVKLITNRNPSV